MPFISTSQQSELSHYFVQIMKGFTLLIQNKIKYPAIKKQLINMAKKEGNETPLMQQYYATKAKYPDAILLYRMGDFYETFGADAITTSRIPGITFNQTIQWFSGTVELAGFPYHAIDTYLPKLCPCRTAGSYL